MSKAWYVLLLLPFIATLFPSLYNSWNPTLFGFPFFYWYQMLWVILSAACTGLVYLAERRTSAAQK